MPPSEDTSCIESCRRCGTCCTKSGPALHLEDRHLVESGKIPLQDLYTIRRGELIRENVRGHMVAAPSDIIKILAREGSWTCFYYRDQDCGCGIYADRPMECRLLKCWDPSNLEAVYDKDRLTREDLLSTVPDLLDLVREHERQCDYELLRRLFDQFDKDMGRETLLKRISEIVIYDTELRRLLVEKGTVAAKMLDFLFGRPLTKTLPMFGYRVRKGHRGLSLEPVYGRTVLRSAGGAPCMNDDPTCVRTR